MQQSSAVTNEEWESSDDPDPMHFGLHTPVNDTRLRLWCCACVRRVWEHIAEEGRDAVVASEHFAKGSITEAELDIARSNAASAVASLPTYAASNAQQAATWCASREIDILGIARSVAWGAAYAIGMPETAEGSDLLAQERQGQADLLRQIFANT
ncbi:MAG TPA: hypothetical protein PK992_08560 [Planctomycetaceae bacterium]|nr:hypothetical protein [Planctomycetaceae bacterium]HRA88107.1 hypothetical protein [Planctomycetaceae bacterium]